MSNCIIKKILSWFVPVKIWNKIRLNRILKRHKKVARLCEKIVLSYHNNGGEAILKQLRPNLSFETDKIIWQYWAQGYENPPEIVQLCLNSVERFAGDYILIRVSDQNLAEYISLPDWILSKRSKMTTAHFSDIIRVALLSVYGGIWIDATVYMSGPIPDQLRELEFFVFQRDPNENNKEYWENSYAYYFGWSKGFRVNMLSSIMWARKNSSFINDLCGCLLKWWDNQDYLPDYFFLQIMFDCLKDNRQPPISSDCLPHFLMQMCNDSTFCISNHLFERTVFHKLSYKSIDIEKLKVLIEKI